MHPEETRCCFIPVPRRDVIRRLEGALQQFNLQQNKAVHQHLAVTGQCENSAVSSGCSTKEGMLVRFKALDSRTTTKKEQDHPWCSQGEVHQSTTANKVFSIFSVFWGKESCPPRKGGWGKKFWEGNSSCSDTSGRCSKSTLRGTEVSRSGEEDHRYNLRQILHTFPLSPISDLENMGISSYSSRSTKAQVFLEEVDKVLRKVQSRLFRTRCLPSTAGYSWWWRLQVEKDPSLFYCHLIPVAISKFRIKTITSVLSSIWKGDIMFSIDMKDAYFQIPTHLESK